MSTRHLAFIALYAAVIAVLGLLPKIAIPIAGGVPVTAQTLGVMLAGVMLGPVRGFLACALFLFVIALGAPLLAGGRGGLGVFFGPSAGFLAAWPLGAFVTGWAFQKLRALDVLPAAAVASALGGIGVIYAVGIPVLSILTDLSLTAAAVGSLTFVPGDLIKALLVGIIARTVFKFQPDFIAGRT